MAILSLATMDEGAGVAWRLPQGAGGLRGSGGGGGRGCEAGGLGGVRLSASRAWLGTVASTASPGRGPARYGADGSGARACPWTPAMT